MSVGHSQYGAIKGVSDVFQNIGGTIVTMREGWISEYGTRKRFFFKELFVEDIIDSGGAINLSCSVSKDSSGSATGVSKQITVKSRQSITLRGTATLHGSHSGSTGCNVVVGGTINNVPAALSISGGGTDTSSSAPFVSVNGDAVLYATVSVGVGDGSASATLTLVLDSYTIN